ncbi:hypothetical protein JH06_2493 [Blastocystis sp. subtype 4]|uniref:hypothetical protein n=1 Tax=Blastocystis sp. subtype 4 TaxID=944170 RepID=UPI000712067C|nr:hypothetical protein JH06_2493 [Blastocystis sp. subtype 4]KNB43907.1 hypothetical protein JH06_2493 [Blastocystis sp. subtype 4]|eukprot:XP_014527350.1 hypothetical protein JH06_2493 [Blastocystis sp. subtype 4]
MDYQSIWEDCIYKMEDLGCSIDELSATELPKLPLGQDCCVGPIILSVMNDIQSLENRLAGDHLMCVEYSLDDYLPFAYQRGFLKYGDDEMLNTLMAIVFLLEELQMNRILFYRRSHAKQSILSPNRNVEGLKQRVNDLAISVTGSTTTESAIHDIYSFCEVMQWRFNPHLLDRSVYSAEDIEKLAKYNQFCDSLYHNKKIMMVQRLDVTIQSLLWNQPQKFDTTKIGELRNEIDITHVFSVDTVSTAAYKNKGSFRNTRIAAVPDRGGRVTDDTVSVEPVPKSTNKRLYDPKQYEASVKTGKVEVTSEKNDSVQSPPEFSEVQKVLTVFGSEMKSDNVVKASNSRKKVCWDYRKGYCKYGDKCKYSHD